MKGRIKLYIDDSELSRKAEKFLSDNNLRAEVIRNGGDLPAYPSFEFEPSRILYVGVPEGIEKKLFMKTIEHLQGKDLDSDVMSNAERIRNIKGVEVTVFVAPFCPHCGKVVRKLVQISALNPAVRITIVDATQFPSLAEEFEIISVPVIFIEKIVRISGEKNLEELLDWLERYDDPEFLKDFVEKMIAEGRAKDVAQTVINLGYDEILANLIEKGDFFKRLGAMYLLEVLYERDKKAVKRAKERIKKLLNHDDFRIREDAAMILGKIGEIEDIELLEKLEEENEEVRESINEAIEEIKMRLDNKPG
jgi:glutaredoxin